MTKLKYFFHNLQNDIINSQSNNSIMQSNMQSYDDLELSNKQIRDLLYWDPCWDPRHTTDLPITIQIEEKYPDHKINWHILSQNPNRIPLRLWDYDDMKKKMKPLAEEIVAYVFHPVRMNRIAEQYNIPFDELITDIY